MTERMDGLMGWRAPFYSNVYRCEQCGRYASREQIVGIEDPRWLHEWGCLFAELRDEL